jgi:uncharacterized membrane protein YdfJ with MMPL/SSD domain
MLSRIGTWCFRNRWATLGIWLVVLVGISATAGVVGYFGISKANELESMRTDSPADAAELEKAKKSARTLLAISDVAAGLAVVTGGVALYLTLSHPSEKSTPSVALGIAPNGLRLRGSF